MAEISIYVALITAVAALTPQVIAAVRDVRRAERDRQERLARERRDACVQMLSTALDLRILVQNISEYHGDEMPARLGEIRKCAAAVEVRATEIVLMVSRDSPGLAEVAERLAEIAGNLGVAAANNASLRLGASLQAADFRAFNECVSSFKRKVAADGESKPAELMDLLVPGQALCNLAMLRR
jgi:hypothetical protein